jgi:hypothetical protein
LCVFGGLGVVSEGSFVFVKSGFEISVCLSHVRLSAVWAF